MDRQAAPYGIASLGAERAAALYVHIPYCLSKCPYCDFNSYAARQWPEAAYAAALERELAAHVARGRSGGREFTTVFFGGGTPSLFEPRTIARLLESFARDARIAADAEITLEANPGTVNEDRLRGFRAAGVNRLSFGVQSFQPDLLLALGRRHSVDDSRAALGAARRAGFENLSLDLIYAVPGQSLAACEADLAEAIAHAPDHVSAYNLTYEKGTALHRDLAEGRVRPAPEELEVAMFHTVRARLGAAGYEPYEISNYAQPGRAAAHNLAYWRGLPYLGLGAGAHSFEPAPRAAAPPAAASGVAPASPVAHGERWQNLRDPNRYMAAIETGGTAIAESETLTRAQAMGEACWLGLRELAGLEVERFAERFDEPLERAFPHVAQLLADGLVERSAGRLALSERGLLVADSVFGSFF